MYVLYVMERTQMKLTEKNLRKFLRDKMKKVPSDKNVDKLKTPFGFCFSQATFDILLAIDLEFKLNAFIKQDK